MLTAGCRATVAGYTVKREYFNAEFSAGIENIAYRRPRRLQLAHVPPHREAQGLSLERLAAARRRRAAAAAWNPIGGFTDDFGRLMWFAIGDPAAIPSPYDDGWVLNRISEVEARRANEFARAMCARTQLRSRSATLLLTIVLLLRSSVARQPRRRRWKSPSTLRSRREGWRRTCA